MHNVDIIMSSRFSKGIGPVQTIKRIIKNHDFFAMHGYDVSAFTLDNISAPVASRKKNSRDEFVLQLKKIAHFLSQHSKLYSSFRIWLMFREPKRLLEYYFSLDREPDILVFHSLMDCYMYLRKYRVPNVKVALFTHSDGLMFKMLLSYFPVLRGGRVEKKLNKIAEYIMSNIDIKPCIAKIEEKNLLSAFPQLIGKTCLVENGIDDLTDEQILETNEIKKEDYEFKYRFISAGSINGRKGQDEFVEALSLLPKEICQDIHIDFIGDGPNKSILEDKVHNYQLDNNVSFIGYVPNAEVYKYLARCNIYVLISKLEGLPLSILEAMRSGLGVISTNVSGIPELVGDDNGIVIEPNVNSLAKILNSLSQFDWDIFGNNSRKKFEEHYTFNRMRTDYLQMLNKVMK